MNRVESLRGVISILGRCAFETPVLNVKTGEMYFFRPRFTPGFLTFKFGREEGASDLVIDRVRDILNYGGRSIVESGL